MFGRTCKECNLQPKGGVARHVKSHGMTLEMYALKWVHDGVRPLCKCGCKQETSWNVGLKDYCTFVHGHHAKGRKKSDDEKCRIGAKNSVNMKRYSEQHPEVMIEKVKLMQAAHTPEVEQRRIASTRATYAAMTSDDKVKFSEHTRSLWQREDRMMHVAHAVASKTFKERSAAGEYDFAPRNLKLSDTISRMYVEGGYAWSKGVHSSRKTRGGHAFRSSWELILYMELDADDDVVMYETEFVRIPYLLDGKERTYVPDLHVVRYGTPDELIEVKPFTLRSRPANLAKELVAREFCASRGWAYVQWPRTLDDEKVLSQEHCRGIMNEFNEGADDRG